MTTTASAKPRIFFPNLDGLRFICFFMVFLFHCYKTIFRGAAGTEGYAWIEFLFANGELGVNFFFVLSGFLITYLLIREREWTGKIHLGNFYLRRILRIWPLFYLCVAVGFILFPLAKQMAGQEAQEIARPLYYLFFAGNFDYISSWPAFPDALILIVLWSVAVEEQFYLVWPVLLKWIRPALYPLLFLLIIAGTLVFRSFYTGGGDHAYAVRNFHTFAVIGDMAAGALMAWYCSYENGFLKRIRAAARWQVLLLYLVAVVLILFREQIFHVPLMQVTERICYAVVFALIIAEQNFTEKSPFKLSRWKLGSRLGVYTYGLYCLHFLVISFTLALAQKAGLNTTSIATGIAVAVLALIVTTGAAFLSYHLYERHFLKLKDRFAFIVRQSG